MATQENIKVFGRVRPMSKAGNASCLRVDSAKDSIIVKNSTDPPREFAFNKVFDGFASQVSFLSPCFSIAISCFSYQEAVFFDLGRPVVDGFFSGINGTIFAYGQTGSGKTFTMLGPDTARSKGVDHENQGMIPRALEYIFFLLNKEADMVSFSLNYIKKK